MMWLIGLDDTDMPGTRGTGRLARMLTGELAERLVGAQQPTPPKRLLRLRRPDAVPLQPCGVTRHQLLVHPDIPYTSHNSCACIAAEGEIAGARELFEWMGRFVGERSPEGSDPGVCMVRTDRVNRRIVDFGRRAQQEVVRLSEARKLGSEEGLLHAGLGGTEDGMIGALAAVGLRAGGEDGRFIELGGIREFHGKARVQSLLDAGIDAVDAGENDPPAPDDWVETFGWVRPRLQGGRAVLAVTRSTGNGATWMVADRRERDRKVN